jgi:hypothetical protein
VVVSEARYKMLTKPPETAQLDFAAVLLDIHKIL